MKEDKFIKQNAGIWSSLEETLKKLKRKGLKRFAPGELDHFIANYNRISGHLSYSRTYYGNTETTHYLNKLVAEAHNVIYAAKTSRLKAFVLFYLRDFPLLMQKKLKVILLSTMIFLAGMLLSFIYTLISPDNAYAFLPAQIVESINFSGDSGGLWNGPIMSSYIFTNNIRVGFLAFALGITLGIGTIWALVYNSFILGGLGALAVHHGGLLRFLSLILPHGVLELYAIFLCGAAGLIIGYSLISPGSYSRKDSIIIRGKEAIKLVMGTIPIFVVAGLIEGFVTPLPIPEIFKLAFAFFTFVLLLVYLLVPVLLYNKRMQNKKGRT